VRKLALFLDDGGVINDNRLRGAQWQQLVARYFSPILGGSPQAWAAANYEIITSILGPQTWPARLAAHSDYESFERAYYIDWLGAMCDIVGVPRPPEEEMIDLSRRATAWIIPQVRSTFPGAAEAIRLLHTRGHPLYTASGASSTDLYAYLHALDVHTCFQRLYGPDLINTFKNGPAFYERLLADAGVDPTDALIVDDSHHAIAWASTVGVRSVLVGSPYANEPSHLLASIGSLAELPEILDGLV
jgi:HAD superfamily hydrolase (TIGR01509 family)